MTTQETLPSGDLFARAIARLEPEHLKCLGLAGSGIPAISVVNRFDSAYSALARIELRRGGSASQVFVKLARRSEDDPFEAKAPHDPLATEFRALQRVGAVFQDDPQLGVPLPIAYNSEDAALVTLFVQADDLGRLLRCYGRYRVRGAPNLLKAFSLSGAWLRKLHEASSDPPSLVSLEELRNYFEVRLRFLLKNRSLGFDEAWVRELLERFDLLASCVDPRDLVAVTVHGDFCPPNILYRAERLWVVDFTQCRQGSRLHDLTHLYFHLRKLEFDPRYSKRLVQRLMTELIAGFDPTLEISDPQFVIFEMRHIICYLCQTSVCRSPRPIGRIYTRFLVRRFLGWLDEVRRSTA